MSDIQLVDVYLDGRPRIYALSILYALLKERLPHQSISHRGMPTWEEHSAFVRSRPYAHWYLIEASDIAVGATYLSHQREIGIFVRSEWSGHRFGEHAVRMLMALHPGKFLANVNPANGPSAAMFQRLGFSLIQHTYAYEPSHEPPPP